MATREKINYRASVIPREEVDLADGSDISYNVHSQVDTTPSSDILKTYTDGVGYKNTIATTTSFVGLNSMSLTNAPSEVAFLFIKIISAASSSTPDVRMLFDGASTQNEIKLRGVGDFCVIPLQGSVLIAEVKLKSSGSTTIANIEILVGGN
tara:strand:+ start:7956 stop:8411 length:456 start_codon:yes stop_codon:yes gene_type:complete